MDWNDLDDRTRNPEILAWAALIISVVLLITTVTIKLLR